MNAAQLCKARGWTVGTYYAFDLPDGREVRLVTAIGERAVLTKDGPRMLEHATRQIPPAAVRVKGYAGEPWDDQSTRGAR